MLELPTSDDLLPDLTDADQTVGAHPTAYAGHSIELLTPWRSTTSTQLQVAYRRTKHEFHAVIDTEPMAATAASYKRASGHQIDLKAPVELTSCAIDKPWGQELWFSGIEARGESCVRVGGELIPFSHYLALAPQLLCRRAEPLLLKVLDPASDPVLGDLYFETHDQKHEVYVVTHVDTSVWPNGVGTIRFGLNQTKRAQYESDAQFRAAYLNAVQAYEHVRRAIDATDSSEGVASELTQREAELRREMYAFTQLHDLAVGDLVQVPPGVPHALQHGVRVFEFQTPVYERNIISFNQRVLTQDHWDSEYAIAAMQLDAVPLSAPVTLFHDANAQCERIADFADFEVQRLALNGAATWQPNTSLPPNSPYLMVALISGNGVLNYANGQLVLGAASAAFVPNSVEAFSIAAAEQGHCTLLVAAPKPHTANSIPIPTPMKK